MTLIDEIIAKVQAAPIDQSGNLTLKSSDFEQNFMGAFFSKLLQEESLHQEESLLLKGATKTPGVHSITVTGSGDFLKYSDLTLSIAFRIQADEVVGTVIGAFSRSHSIALPVITWIDVGDIVLTKSIFESFQLTTLTFKASILVKGSDLKIPIEIQSQPGSEWHLAIAENTEAGITGDELVSLLSGNTLNSFMPQPLVSILNGIKINGIEAVFDTEQKTVSYFSIGVSVTNGWEIAPKVSLKPGLQIDLTLINPTNPTRRVLLGRVAGTFDLDGTELPIFIGAASGGSTLCSFGIQPGKSVTLPSFSNLLGLAGGQDFLATLPADLSKIPQIKIDTLEVDFDPDQRNLTRLSFSIQTASSWPIIADYFEIVSLGVAFDITNVNDSLSRTIFGGVRGIFLIKSVPVLCSIEKTENNPDWTIMGGLPPGKTVSLRQIASALFEGKVSLPEGIPDISFSKLQVAVVPGRKSFSFSAQSADPWPIVKQLSVNSFDLSFTRDPSRANSPITGHIATSLKIAKVTVNLRASLNETPSEAGWAFSGTINTEISFSEIVADLASKLGVNDLPAVPAELDVTLTSLSVNFHTGKKELVLVAETAHGSTGVIVVSAADKTKAGVLMDIHVGLGASSFPLVGETIAKIEDIGIENLQVIITSDEFKRDEIEALNAIIGNAAKSKLPALTLGLAKGGQLGVTYSIGGKSQPPLTFQLTGAGKGPGKKQLLSLGDVPPAAEPPPEAWLDIQRSFGPVNIKRIGIGYASPKAILKMDAALTLAGLTANLEGLSLEIAVDPKKRFDPLSDIRPNLDGMSVTYQSGPLQISGGFVNCKPAPAGLKYEYKGELLIQAEGFGLAAIGSFAELTTGQNSLFLFGVLNATLGGPAFFVVTGIAAGFGYNRSLTLPTLDQVPEFPLIAAAMGTSRELSDAQNSQDAAAALKTMDSYVYAAVGENWVAAGIKFTSFKILESFALLTVSFGNRFEIALLGLSSLTMPPLTPPDKAVGFAQLSLEASYAPEDGVLKIAAQLTPESYILSQKCHLTGGFALYTWFKDEVNKERALVKDGFRAGDFVVSLGGYSPFFTKPPYYPSVPRVGANWQVSDNLTIKGGLYFALTPVAVMAGGALEANFESGNFKAWFNAKVDFLLYWEPFHYRADLSLSLGASYTLGCWTITVHVGVDLTLHGPEFGGTMVLDLYVFSVTIPFGPEARTPERMDWDTFEAHFLPPVQSQTSGSKLQASSGVEANHTDSICFSRAGSLIKELPANSDGDSVDWIVNPEEFFIVTSSAIPCSEAALFHDKPAWSPEPSLTCAEPKFGVTPCGIVDSGLKSRHTITWATKEGGPVGWSATPVTNRMPCAAWHGKSADDLKNLPTTAELNGDRVTGELTTGFILRPLVKPPDKTLPIKVAVLTANPKELKDAKIAPWAVPDYLTDDTFDQEVNSRWKTLANVNAPELETKRKSVASALERRGVAVGKDTNTQHLKVAATNRELLDVPALRHLAEMKLWQAR